MKPKEIQAWAVVDKKNNLVHLRLYGRFLYLISRKKYEALDAKEQAELIHVSDNQPYKVIKVTIMPV